MSGPNFEDFGEMLRRIVEWHRVMGPTKYPMRVQMRRLDVDLPARCQKIINAGLARQYEPRAGNILGVLTMNNGNAVWFVDARPGASVAAVERCIEKARAAR